MGHNEGGVLTYPAKVDGEIHDEELDKIILLWVLDCPMVATSVLYISVDCSLVSVAEGLLSVFTFSCVHFLVSAQ